MIVVLGSRHDASASALTALWPGAVLCSAEDLIRPGWTWQPGERRRRTWVIDAKQVPDEAVTGVFLRRSAVYPEELAAVHPADRAFVAAEAHAFLSFVLATTGARVVNPVVDGAFGEEALRPERWTAAAQHAGIHVRPLRIASKPRRRTCARTYVLEAAGAALFGKAPRRILEGVRRLAEAAGIAWAAFVFDDRDRLVSVTGARRPSDAAARALGRLLAGRTR